MEAALPLSYVVKSSGTGNTVTGDTLVMNGGCWATYNAGYLEIEPGIYDWNIVYSNASGNQIHFGWERYDSGKTSTSNNSTIYMISTKGPKDREDLNGTIDLRTDSGGRTLKYTKLRLLNQWTNSTLCGTTATSTIYYLSLRKQQDTRKTLSIGKNGMAETDTFSEFLGPSVRKNGITSSNGFIEN